MNFKFSLLPIFFLYLVSQTAFGAACCSTSSAAPSMILGDDFSQLAFSVSHGKIIGDAPDQGIPVFRSSDHSEVTNTYVLDYAQIIEDRWQFGANVSMVQKNIDQKNSEATATRLGDLRGTASYEILPEWTYSPWKPRGFQFLQVTIPVARSIYESQELYAVDATGRGFYTIATGTVLTKNFTTWSAYFIPEFHYSLKRKFSTSPGNRIEVNPGFGASAAFGMSRSYFDDRFNFGYKLQPTYGQRKKVFEVQNDLINESNPGAQLAWNAGVELSFAHSEEWSYFGSYIDQTLLGPVKNTTLARIFSIGIQRKWPR